MPIHIVLGKPGSGKSRWSTGRIIRELVDGHRNIVTNVPLRVGQLSQYLQKTYPDRDLRVLQRLRILGEDDLRLFYKFRSPLDPDRPQLEPVKRAEELRPGMNSRDVRRVLVDQEREAEDHRDRDRALMCMPQSTLGELGVAYFLDEAHIAFNARNWMATGAGVLNYLSQHRKLGDEIYPITQSAGNLDKQFRSVTEDYTVLRNEYTAQFGIFKGRGRFVAKTYYDEPGKGAVPYKEETFQIDPDGIGSCYDTAKGIGVSGTAADIGRRAKGINILWTIPGGLGLASLCYFVPVLMGKAASGYINKGAAPASVHAPAVTPGALGALAQPMGGNPPSLSKPRDAAPDAPRKEDEVTMRGYVIRGGRINVYLSDGRTLTETDGTISRIERNFVELRSGERYWLKTPPSVARSDAPAITQRNAPQETPPAPPQRAVEETVETPSQPKDAGSFVVPAFSLGAASQPAVKLGGGTSVRVISGANRR